MRFSLRFKFIFALLLTPSLLSSCRSGLEPATQELNTRGNFFEAILVEDHTPTMRAVDVEIYTDIVVTFSGAVNSSSVDSYSFRVEDESGRPIDGAISFSNGNRTITFSRTVLNQKAPWDLSTTYRVYTRALLGENGIEISDYDFEFRTAGVGNFSGKFKPLRVEPRDFVIFPDAAFDVVMSEAIAPNRAMCSTSRWQNAFKFYLVNASNQFQLTTLDGKICLLCRDATPDDLVVNGISGGKICDKLRFRPNQAMRSESYLRVEFQPEAASDLLSITGEKAKGKISKDYFIMFTNF